jgi:branched-chain amino acid transport system permease protein
MALGLTISYGVARVFNFAHGILAVLGAYITWLFLTQMGISMIPCLFLTFIITFLFGLVLYKVAIDPLLKQPNWEYLTIIFLLGFAVFLDNILLQIFGARAKYIPPLFEDAVEIGFVRITWHEVSLLVIIIVSFSILQVFLKKTYVGQAMRAVSQEMNGARVVGINVKRTFGLAFALAIAVTGVSGALLGTKYYVDQYVGWDWLGKGFVIVVLGGLGNANGAVYAAFILGAVEALTTLYLGSVWVWPVWFALFLGILLLKPEGIAGGRKL